MFSTQKAAVQITEIIGSSYPASFSQGASLASVSLSSGKGERNRYVSMVGKSEREARVSETHSLGNGGESQILAVTVYAALSGSKTHCRPYST